MVARTQVPEGYNAALVAHLLCSVGSDWIIEGGDLHGADNPHNTRFFEASIAWASSVFGEGRILAARMDLDEKGGGNVDLLVAPVAISKRGKPYLSCSPRLEALRREHGCRRSFQALQNSFAAYLQAHLDPAIQRGKAKEGVGPDRLTPEIYGAKKDIERDRAELAARRDELDRQRAALETERQHDVRLRQELVDHRAHLERKAREFAELESQQTARHQRLATAPDAFRKVIAAYLNERVMVDVGAEALIAKTASTDLQQDIELLNALGLQRVFFDLQRSLETLGSAVDDLRESFNSFR